MTVLVGYEMLKDKRFLKRGICFGWWENERGLTFERVNGCWLCFIWFWWYEVLNYLTIKVCFRGIWGRYFFVLLLKLSKSLSMTDSLVVGYHIEKWSVSRDTPTINWVSMTRKVNSQLANIGLLTNKDKFITYTRT